MNLKITELLGRVGLAQNLQQTYFAEGNLGALAFLALVMRNVLLDYRAAQTMR